METSWGSKNAEGMYQIATRIAGFDPIKLMLEITRRQGRNLRKVNESTVLAAMQALEDEFDGTSKA
jgi:hypothetical protein